MTSHKRREAITLRTYPFGEANSITAFLTREEGKLRGVAYGARKSASRFGSSLEPLTHVWVSFSRKEQQDLAIIQNCEIIEAFPAYGLTWEQNLHFSYFAELLHEFAPAGMECDKLFRLALAVLGSVKQVPVQVLARYLEFWLLRLEGVLPALDQKLPVDLATKTLELLRKPPDQLPSTAWTETESARLERISQELIEYHLEKSLKARKLLKELL